MARGLVSAPCMQRVLLCSVVLAFFHWLLMESFTNLQHVLTNEKTGYDVNRNATDSEFFSLGRPVIGNYVGVATGDEEITFGKVEVYSPILEAGTLLKTVRSIVTNQDTAPEWQKNILRYLTTQTRPTLNYYLTVITYVRIHDDDPSKFTIAELKQWMHFLFYAGVDHLYVCNYYLKRFENLKPSLHQYMMLGLVSFTHWNFVHTESSRANCYNYYRTRPIKKSLWQLTLNMNEYPFCPGDQKSGFLRRFLERYTSFLGNLSTTEIRMPVFGVEGAGDRTRDLLIESMDIITVLPIPGQTLPLYRPSLISKNERSFVFIKYGKTVFSQGSDICILRYLGKYVSVDSSKDGADLDRNFIEHATNFNAVMASIAQHVRHSLMTFNESVLSTDPD